MWHKTSKLIGFLFLLCSVSANTQSTNPGTFSVRHFAKKEYKAGTQNWDIAQDTRGVMYFANNEGMLRFNGVHWDLFPVSNRTIVRSLLALPDGKIYAGAQSELGYFFPNPNGTLQYHSLTAAIPPEQRQFADVWDIVDFDGKIWFRTEQSIYVWDGQLLRLVYSANAINALFRSGSILYLQQGTREILRWNNTGFIPEAASAGLNSEITGALVLAPDTLLLTSLKDGIFQLTPQQLIPVNNPLNGLFREKRIYTSALLHDGQTALGSTQFGLLLQDSQQQLSLQLDKSNGLQNSTILSLFEDRSGKLWLGLDNGIDCVDLCSAFTNIKPDGSLESPGYTAAIREGQLYLGVANGLYATSWKQHYLPEEKNKFRKVTNTEGQTWGLKQIGNQLLLGHHEGAFEVAQYQATPISSTKGSWNFVEIDDQTMMGGNYTGLTLFAKSASGHWVPEHQFEALKESCRVMVRDEKGFIWVSHPYRGLYKVSWNPARRHAIEIAFYDETAGLPSVLNNYVFLISGKMVVGTTRGVYRFDENTARFYPDTLFNEQLGGVQWIKHLCQDKKGNIWFVANTTTGVLKVDDFGLRKTVHRQIYPQLNGKLVGGFEFIYPYDDNNVFFGAEEGFIHFNPNSPPSPDTLLQVLISGVTLTGAHDSLLFGGQFVKNGSLQSTGDAIALSAVQNNLCFRFAATDYGNPELIQYRTRLEGMEKKWSEWSSLTERCISNLPSGNFSFQVQSRRLDGLESAVTSVAFRIQPPWYNTLWARGLYVLGFIALLFSLQKRQKRQFETEKAELQEQHQQKEEQHIRKVEQTQEELSTIRNEKLEVEIQFKNQELASATMHLVQKGEMLVTISDTLKQILQQTNNTTVKKEIRQLLSMLNFDQKLDEDWEQFAYYFDQVHVDYLRRLREKHPQLSPNDFKLCAYLRMNLSTKEIATLMNISVRGVEASRYRLRKRLDLDNEVNLNEFIAGV